MTRRTLGLTTFELLAAVLDHPPLFAMATDLFPPCPVGRPPKHHPALLLAFGVLARAWRSGARCEAELADPVHWQHFLTLFDTGQQSLPEALRVPRPEQPPTWSAYRHFRDRYLTSDGAVAKLQDSYLHRACAHAIALGLLPLTGGSWSHPHPTRTIYGDGTVVRPLYKPPAVQWLEQPDGQRVRQFVDRRTGEVLTQMPRRVDLDAADWYGHTGLVHGNNFVAFHVRGTAVHERVVLAVGRVDYPGGEAAEAVRLTRLLHAQLGDRVQAAVYDGAWRGVHIDEVMRNCGWIVINKVALAAREPQATKTHTLGLWEHTGPHGPCHHELGSVDGAVVEIDLSNGLPTGPLPRRQVKRTLRRSGEYHFNVGYTIACPAGEFVAWLTPHGEGGDRDHQRAEWVRVIARGEPDFDLLYGLRNDSESFHAQYKRTLLVDRAMSLGWRRQLLDVVCFGLLNNALAGQARPTR